MDLKVKTVIALILGVSIFGSSQAMAESRPDYCPRVHDHRSHNASYYNYYEKDDYYRAGEYRGTQSRANYESRYDGRRGRRYDNNRRDRSYSRRARSRVVNRDTFSTKWRARIVLVEEIYWTRSGREQLVCTVLARGPEADYIPRRRLKRVARNNCSRYARIQYHTRRGY